MLTAGYIEGLTDDEAIATATLLGGIFGHEPNIGSNFEPWVCYGSHEGNNSWDSADAETKPAAARRYLLRNHTEQADEVAP